MKWHVSTTRISLLLVLLFPACSYIAGCGQGDYRWNARTGRFERVNVILATKAPPDRPQRQATHDTEPPPEAGRSVPVTQFQKVPEPPPQKPQQSTDTERTSEPRSRTIEQPWRLVLVAADAQIPAIQYGQARQLAHASPNEVARLLTVLYPAVGPSAGQHRCHMLYDQKNVGSQASQAVALLDVPGISDVPAEPSLYEGATAGEAFQQAVALMNGMRHPVRIDPARRQRISGLLVYAANHADDQPWLRWASSLLCGYVQWRDPKQVEQAEESYRNALALTGDGSYERLVSLYHLAGMLKDLGRHAEIAQLYDTYMNNVAGWDHTVVYRRCQELAERNPQPQ